MTNYERFFGSPERVALTVATVDEWLWRRVSMASQPEDGKEWFAPGLYYLFSESLGGDFDLNAMAMFGWLNRRVDE